MKRHISHGEVNLLEVNEIPTTATKINPTADQIIKNGFKIANSEATGNHHLVKINDQIEFFEDNDGTLFIRNLQPTTVECVDTKRHDSITLPSSIWKRKVSREIDHLTNIVREIGD